MALKNIIGQEKALRILSGTLKRGRIPSAILMSGDAGIGKKYTALNYAKAVNCLNPVDFDCCDTCISCKKIDSHTHPDVSLIIPDNDEIKIEAVRKIGEILSFKPYEGREKVVIIDEAEKMNINAANSFLKTLEEPPSESIIVLISSVAEGLLDTIRSRCMNVKFNPLNLNDSREILSRNLGSGYAELLLKLSMGRPGIALSRDLKKERDWFVKLFNDMVRGEPKEGWTDKAEIRAWFDMASVLLRDSVVNGITEKESDLMLGKRQMTARTNMENADMEKIFSAYQEIERIRNLLDLNLNKSITWNYVAGIMKDIS